MRTRSFVLLTLATAACMSPRERQRADSAQALASRQRVLMDQLVAQRDSVSRVLVDADLFIGKIDSSISRVKGLGTGPRAKRASESGLEDQLRARKEMLRKVDALVTRARETARQVAELKDREAQLLAENGKLRDSLNIDALRIVELSASIEKQAQMIAMLEARVDGLNRELVEAREAVTKAYAVASRAYYVIGSEDELLKKGVVVKEGGANLLVARVGRTLVPARDMNKDVFTLIDMREVHQIALPDSSRRYQIVSRQNLDDAKVGVREGAYFRGPLEIPEADRFWAASKYLIIVQR
jgi:regulator of replication initiation timing